MSHKIKLIGDKMQFIVKPEEPYFDPATGLYIPSRPNPPCSGIHDLFDLYWEPCLDCEKFCNCALDKKYPDVLVTSLEGLTIRVSGHVVASSNLLVKLVDERRQRGRNIWLNNLVETLGLRECEEIEVIDLTSDSEENKEQGRQIPTDEDLTELFEFPQNEVCDLRNIDEPAFGLTVAQWNWLEKFISLHLDQVDENIAAERRAREYFRLSVYNRPTKDPINHWGYYDWEEDLFMNLSPEEMIQLSQIKNDLMICDLNAPVGKWFNLRRGFPNIRDFGWGQYRTDLSEELCDSGIEDFLWGRPRVIWNQTVTIHSIKMRKDDPRNALKFRKRIWRPWPRSNLCRYRRR